LKVFLRMEYPFKFGNNKKESLGIHTANTQFLVNLIKYSQVIEEFGLVVSDSDEQGALNKLFPEKIINGHDFSDQKELVNILQYYDIFFMGGYGIVDILKGERFFHQGLSVIGITHSIHLEEVAKSLKGASEFCSKKDALICTSSTARKAVAKMTEGPGNGLRLETIPLGVDVDRYHPIDEGTKREHRARFDWPEDEIIFLYMGRLSPDEKTELTPLIKTFAELVRISTSGEKARLLIIGREHNTGYIDILSDLIKKLDIEDRVKIISDYDASHIPLYYGMADVFVSPSDNIQETFGLSVIEAMASELPVIVSDWDGYRDTVADGGTGFLIPTYWADCGFSWGQRFQLAQSVAVDMDRLMQSMQTLLENKELRKSMGKAGRQRAESKFSWEKVIKQYDTLLHKVASGKRGDPEVDGKEALDPSDIFLNPTDTFKSYPTEFLTKDFCIRIRDIDAFTAYSNVVQLVDAEMVNHIANLVARGVGRVGDIIQELDQAHGAPAQKTLFQIMIMLKYGVFAAQKILGANERKNGKKSGKEL
jgi:glycosyltransferase involved in cell wall biosynthesis